MPGARRQSGKSILPCRPSRAVSRFHLHMEGYRRRGRHCVDQRRSILRRLKAASGAIAEPGAISLRKSWPSRACARRRKRPRPPIWPNRSSANMSHELRTPLNAIIGFSEALELGVAEPLLPVQAEYAELIHRSGKHPAHGHQRYSGSRQSRCGRVRTLREEGIDPRHLVESCVAMVRGPCSFRRTFPHSRDRW